MNTITTSKLQKVLADAGVASRREVERWIHARRIRVNGRIAEIGERVKLNDKIYLDGKLVRRNVQGERARVLLYHKPEGEVCTRSDEAGRPTIFDRLPQLNVGRWVSVGRLDLNSSGLLLLTNDGQLAHRLMHPSFSHEREYVVRVFGHVTSETIKHLTQGIMLDGKRSCFKRIQAIGGVGRNRWYSVTLMEGRYRIVRRLWESQNMTVSRLIRTRFAKLKLPKKLLPGQWEEIPTELVAKDSIVTNMRKRIT